VGARRVLELLAFERAWYPAETNLRCVKFSHFSSFCSFRDHNVYTNS